MKILSVTTAILIMLLTLTGCVVRQPETTEEPRNIQPADEQEPDSQPQSPEYVVYLYFGDSQAMGFNREERTIDVVTPEKLIEELINGPVFEQNKQTIPDGTKLIDIKIEDKIAYVNFSRELTENHWGGSAGESMTIGSIVNTLALNEGTGIEKVQILVNGEKIETLAGHIDTSIPLEPTR
jgi:spore germination protein GerM